MAGKIYVEFLFYLLEQNLEKLTTHHNATQLSYIFDILKELDAETHVDSLFALLIFFKCKLEQFS